MKATIENLETKITVIDDSNNPTTGTYFLLLKACVNKAPQNGFTPKEMKERLDLLNLLDTEEKEIEITSMTQLDKIKSLVADMTWNQMSKDLVQFSNYIEGLKLD